jgi:hypothetical protein
MRSRSSRRKRTQRWQLSRALTAVASTAPTYEFDCVDIALESPVLTCAQQIAIIVVCAVLVIGIVVALINYLVTRRKYDVCDVVRRVCMTT